MSNIKEASHNESYWRQQLVFSDWYVRLADYLNEIIFPIVHDNPQLKTKRHKFYDLVTDMLDKNLIPLADSGPDMDKERLPIDTIVIHHTEEVPDISLAKLSAIGFIRQYGLGFLNDNFYGRKRIKGKPIWSGHFRDGEQVFFAYHWLVRPDGKAERLLEDKYIGRQAMELSPRSIGIAFSGIYEHSTPPVEQIKTAAELIKNNYSFIDINRIFGHREIVQGRTCPGDKFLGGWKNTLLDAVKSQS